MTIDENYNTTDTKPDMIINPNAIPKRMTIGQLIECISGNKNATSFPSLDIDKLKKELVVLGYNDLDTQPIYNGPTGEKVGPIIITMEDCLKSSNNP